MAAILLCLDHVLELVQGHEDLGDRGQLQMDLWPGGAFCSYYALNSSAHNTY